MEEMNDNKRLELSLKTHDMAKALIKEGRENENKDIESMGNMFMAIAGLIVGEGDMIEMEEYMSYFMAKKAQDKISELSKRFGTDLGLGGLFGPNNHDSD